MFSEPCFRDTYTARLRQKRGKIILSLRFSSNLLGVSGGQADMYPWSELLERHSMIFLWILWDHWLWFCVSETVHL